MNNTKVIILAGIPASGKSTWAKDFFKSHRGTHLSSDHIRFIMERTTGEWTNAEVFETMRENLFHSIKEEREFVVYDATNINRKRRRGLYREIKQKYPDTHVEIKFFSISAYDAMGRNSLRDKKERVPHDVVWKMYKNYQVPRKGVDCDSFEVLGLPIFEKGDFKNYDDLFIKVIGMGHSLEMLGNMEDHSCPPWHLETIEEHLNLALNNADDDLKEVALFHDLGKSFCRETDKTGYSTFRGHANLSSHYFLNYLAFTKYKDEEIPEFELENVEVIIRHMDLFGDGLGNKNIRNNKLNEKIVDKLNRFNIIDKESRITENT